MTRDNLVNYPTNELNRVVHEIIEYIDPFQVKVILDVGSRDARESISLKRFFPYATIYAFECNPPAIELCKKNIANHADIFLVPKAVSDVDGPLDFYAIDPEKTVTSHSDGNIGASSLYLANPDYPYEKYHQRKITVESTTLERWAKETGLDNIDIIWMDLQGAELKAFKGMGGLLERIKLIYTEVEFEPMYIGQPLFKEVNHYLASKGFSLLKIYRSGWFGNIIYVNKSTIHGKKRVVNLYVKKLFSYISFGLSRFKSHILKPVKK
jgi:FkbM family methyltransferase